MDISVSVCRWFNGLTSVYDSRTAKESHRNKGVKTNRTLSDSNRDFMIKLLSEEYIFYEFIKKRFSLILHKAEQELPLNLAKETQDTLS